MSRIHRVLGLTVVVAVLASCSTSLPTGAPGTTNPAPNPAPLAAPSLVTFDACDTFLDYVISNAVDLVGPYGLPDTFNGWWGGPVMFFGEDGAAERAATTAPASPSSRVSSRLNPLPIGRGPKFMPVSCTTAGGRFESSKVPSSM